MAEELKLSVDPKVLQPIIEAQVRAAVVVALGTDSEKIITALVDAALKAKVGNGSYDKTFMQQLVQDVVQGSVKQAAAEWAKEHGGEIAKKVQAKLESKTAGLATMLAEKCVKALTESFYIQVIMKVND